MPDPDTPILATWHANRVVYVRDHVLMAVIGGAIATGVLYALGKADYWVGLVAAYLAIGLRGWYLASEELSQRWDLTPDAVVGSNGKRVALREIVKVRSLGSAVQLVTAAGDKHLMRYLPDPVEAKTRIAAAAGIENT